MDSERKSSIIIVINRHIDDCTTILHGNRPLSRCIYIHKHSLLKTHLPHRVISMEEVEVCGEVDLVCVEVHWSGVTEA